MPTDCEYKHGSWAPGFARRASSNVGIPLGAIAAPQMETRSWVEYLNSETSGQLNRGYEVAHISHYEGGRTVIFKRPWNWKFSRWEHKEVVCDAHHDYLVSILARDSRQDWEFAGFVPIAGGNYSVTFKRGR